MSWRLLNWRRLASLRIEEVAMVTGLGVRSVRRLVERGELRTVKVGRAVLVPIEAVLELVGERAPAPRQREPRDVERKANEVLEELRR